MAQLKLYKLAVNKRLYGITEQVNNGERIHLIGANGAGKSTLLMAIAGEVSYVGNIFLNETSMRDYKIAELSRIQSVVRQQSLALPFMPVFHYLSLSYQLSKMDIQELNALLSDFQINKLLSKNIHHLSGGEWQRVRIVATFIQLWSSDDLTGKLMMLDEPTNNLDIVQLTLLDKWLDKFCLQGGSIIMSTHDLNHSYLKADKLWFMLEGKIINSGDSALLLDENLLSTTFNTKIRCNRSANSVIWQVIE